MEIIEYMGQSYPALQATGHASRFCQAFALEILRPDKNDVLDIGYGKEIWKLPGASGIDIADGLTDLHAMSLPYTDGTVDGIFSSHFLEHYLGRFQEVIEYWLTKLKVGGHIFIYLPNCEHQKYWAWGNKKHIHYLSPKIMQEFCETLDVSHYLVTEGYDLNSSFYCVITK